MRAARDPIACFQRLERRQLLSGDLDVTFNFQPAGTPTANGTVADFGDVFGDRRNRYAYGWNVDSRDIMRDRNKIADQRLDTVAQIQQDGETHTWELQVPDGQYDVTLTSGDSRYLDGQHDIDAEGVRVMYGVQSKKKPFLEATKLITVTDGRLTISPESGGVNAKLNSVRIVSHRDGQPSTAPLVSVQAIDASMHEEGVDTAGSIRFTRSGGDVSEELTVAFDWSGSAGTKDFRGRPNNIVFAAGSSVATLPLNARRDDVAEATETAKLTLLPMLGYRVGSPASASVTVFNGTDSPTATPPASPVFSDIHWSATNSPPAVFSETTSAVVGNALYLFGGFTANFSPQKNVYRFDGKSWTRLMDAPVAFTQPGAAVVDGKVWFAGGYIGNGSGGQTFGTRNVLIYNPAADSWSVGPSLPSARSTGNLVKVGRKLYFIGGETANRAADASTMFVYDLDHSSAGWITGPSMPLARNRAAAIVVDTKVYILGGQIGFDSGLTAHDEIQVFDTQANTWTIGANKLPAVRTHVMNSAQYLGGKIILVTGENAHDKPQNTVWSIDPSTLVTTALSPFPDARFTTATGIVDGKLYAIGGYHGGIASQGYVGTLA